MTAPVPSQQCVATAFLRGIQIVSVLAVACALSACGTVTKVPMAWKDPAYAGPGFAKIFVIGVGENEGSRRLFEDNLARELTAQGAVAEPSYTRLPETDRLSKGAIEAAMEGGGFDAVTISQLVSERKETEYVPPQTYTVPSYGYGGFYGYYSARWDVVHEPGYYKTNTIVRLETNLYDAANAALVWSGQSDTMNPSSVADTIESAAHAIAARIASDGLLR